MSLGEQASGALEAAIARHLVAGAPAPAELGGLPGAELALLRALCRNSPNRGAVAAEGLAALLAERLRPAAGTRARDRAEGAGAGGGERAVVQGGHGGPPLPVDERPAGEAGGPGVAGYADLLNGEAGGPGVAGYADLLSGEAGGPGGPGYADLLNGEAGGPGGPGYADLLSGEAGDGAEGRAASSVDGRVASPFREGLAEIEGAVLSVQALEEELAVFAPLIGVGWHKAGTALVSVVCERLGDLRSVLSRAPELRRLADLLGRQRQGLARGVGAERGERVTAVGVKVGGGLEDALASELALLADPATEDLFLTRLLERRLVSLEMVGEDEGEPARPHRRRGPAIVLVDTSGSMIGKTVELAKAVALAVVERLTAERRPVELALFGGEGAMRVTRFAERKTSPRELFDFLMTSFHGGTDFDGPLTWALDRVGPREPRRPTSLREADLLLVTDGRARLKKATKERLIAARRAGLQLVVAYVDHGLGYDPRAFSDLADQVAVASSRGLTLLPSQAPKAR